MLKLVEVYPNDIVYTPTLSIKVLINVDMIDGCLMPI
jgi:hypothetical protein